MSTLLLLLALLLGPSSLEEDSPVWSVVPWDCHTMGNHMCAEEVTTR